MSHIGKKIRTLPLSLRQNKMTVADIKQLDEIENTYFQSNKEINLLAQRIVRAYNDDKPVILMMGAHPLRRGNSRIIIDLMERGVISHIATNGAVAIHDFELAFLGATLEDVEFYIKDGKFGNWEETGKYINEAIIWGYKNGFGFGESIGQMILNEECGKMPHKDISIFAAAVRLGIPITVHKGIGYDITDQHPSVDFSAMGKTSGDDFLTLVESVGKLEGGAFLCMGSQVTGPEVYLKALSMARNLAAQDGKEIKHFSTAVLDIVDLGNWREKNLADYRDSKNLRDSRYYFRPLKSILIRTVKDGGGSFYIRGDFAETIPALYKKIISLI